MKSSTHAQSATSLPRAPRDEASRRSTQYLITMGVRIACFALMVLITPYGWYTWIFGAGAIFLPYIAVVFANVGSNVTTGPVVENPGRALEATARPMSPREAEQLTIQLHESGQLPPRFDPGNTE